MLELPSTLYLLRWFVIRRIWEEVKNSPEDRKRILGLKRRDLYPLIYVNLNPQEQEEFVKILVEREGYNPKVVSRMLGEEVII